MAVRKLKSGLWVADVSLGRRLDGSRDRRTESHPTKAAAEKAERRLLLEKERRRGKSYGGILFADFVEHYFWPQKSRLRATTARGYRRDLKLRLLPAFGALAVEDIGRLEIQRMISACPSRKAATNARETLSSILSVAREMGVIDVNPAGFRYQYPAAVQHPADHYGAWLSSFDEIRRVLDWVAAHHPGEAVERMCVLGLCFGLRKGEVLGLDWETVDLEGRTIRIAQTYTAASGTAELTDPKTPRSKRVVPMTAYARERMAAWGPGAGPVVTGRDRRRMSPYTARDRMSAVFDRGARYDDGTPVPRLTLHSCRHSFGTACIAAGVEVARVSKWMGHVDTSTTYNRYVKPKLGDLRAEASAIDAAMGL